MPHPYTWNHLLLFAKLCEKVDDDDSTTASWIEIVEEHHSTTFPFTLWPLSYRTSDVTTSPSICSPMLFNLTTPVCDVSVKIYVCNEVIMVIVQNGTLSRDKDTGSLCNLPCKASGGVSEDHVLDHVLDHREDKGEGLIPCNTKRVYGAIKSSVLPHIYRTHKENSDPSGGVDRVICVGFGFSSGIASCVATDVGKTYETQRQFLGLEEKAVSVDFVGFSSLPLASGKFWERTSGYIDRYVTASDKEVGTNRPGMMMTPRPRVTHSVVVGRAAEPSSRSLFRMKSKKGDVKNHQEMGVSDYISEINGRIRLS
jgi:hypothetical protein